MARAGINKEVNTFTKGLITTANLLAFPESASVVDLNFRLNLDGSRKRRLGLDFETDAQFIESEFSPDSVATPAVSTHTWDNVADDTNLAILVVQIGNFLYFFNRNAETLTDMPLNQQKYLQLLDLDPAFSIETTNMDGNLIVVTGSKLLNVLSYDSSTDLVEQTARNIKIRDKFGVDDSLEVDERPEDLTREHRYNLKNQGWKGGKREKYKEDTGVYPSNADVMFLGKDSNGIFSSKELNLIEFGGTPAAKGHFIIDPFDRGASRDDGLTNNYGGSSTGAGTTTATFVLKSEM